MSRIEKAIEKAIKLRESKDREEPISKPFSDKEEKPDSEVVINEKAISISDKVTIENPYIVTVNDPDSPVAEEYRNLKSMIVKLTHREGFKNTLMVTSSLSNEGKSVSALNLAITLAQEYDYTVLLVDADLRNPFLPKYLNMNPEIGLSDCLLDGLDVSRALIKTGIAKLTFLPAGRSVTNPAELLSSKKMKELINEMKHRYPDRYIIIDTPPVLPFAETRAISMAVDGVIFVVKEGIVSLQSIKDALDVLKGSTILGLVYNNVSVEDLDDHYSYYYSDYYKKHKSYKKSD